MNLSGVKNKITIYNLLTKKHYKHLFKSSYDKQGILVAHTKLKYSVSKFLAFLAETKKKALATHIRILLYLLTLSLQGKTNQL